MAESEDVKVCISNGNEIYEVFVQKGDVKPDQSEPSFLASLLYYAADKVMDSGASPDAPIIEEIQAPEEGEYVIPDDNAIYAEELHEDAISPMTYSSFQEVEGNEKNFYLWSNHAVVLLIQLVAVNFDKFARARYSQKKVWQRIANEMLSHGYTPSPEQCHSKWRNLKRTYKSVKAQSKRFRRLRQEWPFMEAMEKIIGVNSESSLSTYSTSAATFIHDIEDSDEKPQTAQQKRKFSSLIVAIKEMNDENQRAKERRHKEKMAQRERMILLLKKLANY